MPALNKVFLMGNLTRSPELRYTPNGVAICEFGMAVNRRFMSNGIQKEETTFIEVNVWQRQAEICKNRLKKGSLVMVEGRLKTDQWEDRETGKKRSRILVVAERVNFLASPPRDDYQEDYEDDPNGSDTNHRNQGGKYQNQQQNYSQQAHASTQNREKQHQVPVPRQELKNDDLPPPPEPEYDDTVHENDDNENVPF